MAENHIYQAIDRNIQEQTRMIMVAAFSGAGAMAGIANTHQRQLAHAAKIAMTTLNIEQRYPEQFPSHGLPALGNAVMRELQAKGEKNEGEPRLDIATRLVSSVEMQNFADDVLSAADHRHVPYLNAKTYVGVHPKTEVIAQHARTNPDFRQELEHQAHGTYDKLQPDHAEELRADIVDGKEVSDTQRTIISELVAMEPENVDKVFRMAQTDLMGVVMAGETLTTSTHDQNLHAGEMGKTTKALETAIDDYTRSPSGLSAYRLYNQAKIQVDAMAEAHIDVRVRQSFELSVAQVEIRHGAPEAPRQENVARLHAAQSQLGR